MTAFTTADLPTGARACTTIEQLNIWTSQILLVNNAKEKFLRVSGNPAENRFQVSDGVDADSTQRVQTFCVFETDTATLGLSVADWKKIKEASTLAVPAAFKG